MGNELSMNISQVKKLRKIVRMKKLATNNSKIFVCAMKKTSVNYKMVLMKEICPRGNNKVVILYFLIS